MTSPATFEPLGASEGDAFEDLYRIYTESIVVEEQKARDQIAASVERPDYQVLLAKGGGRVIGFSILFLPAGEPFALLEYLAVRPEERSGGVGAELFRRSLPERSVLVEVDSVRSSDRTINQRRISFYRRLGCRRIEGLSYILPLPGSPEMDLMIHMRPVSDHVSKFELERWLKVIYRDVYGCSPEDPRIGCMMATVSDPVKLS